MASNDKWIERVLVKLRHILLSGESFSDYRWQYDAPSSEDSENIALGILQSLGVITAIDSSMSYKIEPDGELRYEGSVTQYKKVITEFNPNNFEKLCHKYGLEPYAEMHRAKFYLLDGVTPVVMVGGSNYKFRSMYEGKPVKIIRYCLTQNRAVDIDELRKVAGVKPLQNITQVFKESRFSKNGALSPFVNISSSKISVKSIAAINTEKLELIRQASKATK